MYQMLQMTMKKRWLTGRLPVAAAAMLGFMTVAGAMTEPETRNLLSGDSSFECGDNGWVGTRDDRVPAADGRFSLRIAPGDVMKFFYPGRPDNHIYKNTLPLRTPCVLSFYARADRDNHPFTMKVVTSRYYKAIASQRFLLTKEWRRYSLPIPPQEPVRELNVRGGAEKFTFRLWWDNSGTVPVWLDAVQITPGGQLRPYRQQDPVTVGIGATASPWNIFTEREKPLALTCQARNNESRVQDVKVTFHTEDFWGKSGGQAALPLQMVPGRTYSWSFPALKTMKPGFYKSVFAVCEPGGKVIATAARTFVVVKPPVAIELEKSLMGIVPTAYCLFPSALVALEQMGVKWLRIMRPNYGTYDWWHKTLDPRKFGVDLSLSIYNPPLDGSRKDKSREELFKIYRKMLQPVELSPVRYIEIENEPDGGLARGFGFNHQTAIAFYLRQLKNGSPALKQLKPGVSILACNGTSDMWSYEDALKYAADSFDVLTYHPYATRRSVDRTDSDCGPESAEVKEKGDQIRQMIKKYQTDKKLWISEIGWQLDDTLDPASEQAKRRARYLARTFLLGKAAGSEKIIYFISCYLDENGGYEWGLWRPNQQPLPDVAVFAATAQVLEGAEYAGPVYERQDFRAYAFVSRNREPFFAIWKTEQCANDISLKFPARNLVKSLDILGNEFALPPDRQGQAVLKITTSPVYLYYRDLALPDLTRLVSTGTDLPVLKLKTYCEHANVVSCEVKNVSAQEQNAVLTVSSPGVLFNQASRPVKLAPNEQKRINFPIAAPETAKTSGKSVKVTARTAQQTIEDVFQYQVMPVQYKQVDITQPFDEAVKGLNLIKISDSASVLTPNPWLLWSGEKDLSVVAATAWDENNFYFLAKVRDDVHCQKQPADLLWKSDSIQLAFDVHGSADKSVHAFDFDDMELMLAVMEGGRTAAYASKKIQHADPVKNLKFIGERIDGYTIYKCAIPFWPGIYMKPPLYNGRSFGFNFIINDDDGGGRKDFMGLTPGIGDEKYPWLYKKFVLVGKPKK